MGFEANSQLLSELMNGDISFATEIERSESSGSGKIGILEYEKALDYIREKVEQEGKLKNYNFNEAGTVKNKAYYRDKMKAYKEVVRNIIKMHSIHVVGYEGEKTKDGVVLETKGDALERLVRDVAADFVGFSVLEQAMEDPGVTDIFLISYDLIYVEKYGKNELYCNAKGEPIKFRSLKHYKDFVDRIMREAGTELNKGEKKIVDFEVYGNRGNAIIDTVATKGHCLTMRKHAEDPIVLQQIIEGGLMSQTIADLLGHIIQGEMNLIYAGITGSGKTTTLRALLDYYVPQLGKRILCAEDTQELFLKNKHTVELKTVHSQKEEESISMEGLIIAALRMKPKYIVVGEVRGAEAQAAVEGMETGHSTIFSMHGGTVWNIVNRLVTKYLMSMPSLGIEVVERIIGSAVDYVAIQDDVPGIGRRVTSIHEITYDFEKRSVAAIPIVEYSFDTQDWEWINPISSEKTRTMLRRGLPLEIVKQMEDLNWLKKDHEKTLAETKRLVAEREATKNKETE